MDKQELRNIVLGDDLSKLPKWYKLFEDPVWIPQYNVDWKTTRDLPMNRLTKVMQSKLVSVKDFFKNPKNIFLAHEMISQLDSATCTKFTVQYNLFGGSITALYTDRHNYLFDKIDDFSIVGCFAITEVGYGNNSVKMETTVTYDASTKEFVVNSPTVLSQKHWITNGFRHANHALVFGQTIVNGKGEGLGAYLVPIRDSNLNELPGVAITDMGIKMGNNGVDNATLSFNNVRIPRENMMNRYTDVDENGNFNSKIKSIGGRFFAVTERLLSGRLCIASMCMGAQRACLYIAITYAKQRMAVGPKGESDMPIFEFQLQQNALMPLLARTISLGMLHVMCKNVFQNPKGHEAEVLSLCCVDKVLVTAQCERVAAICRERCGGQGFLSVNKFGDYLAGAHAGLTAEGDNRVLMVKVCKDMQTNVYKKGHKLPQMSSCPFRQIANFGDITDPETLLDLMKFRETMLFEKLASDQKKLLKEGKSQYQILMRETSDIMQELSWTYGERHAMEQCVLALGQMKNGENRQIMSSVFRVFGIECIRRDISWYLIQGVISKPAVLALKPTRANLIKQLASRVTDILDVLPIAKEALTHSVPIASDYVNYNAGSNHGEIIGAPRL